MVLVVLGAAALYLVSFLPDVKHDERIGFTNNICLHYIVYLHKGHVKFTNRP
ncbi:hypothetical protein Mapa_000112 [Marchantia paleacea]|nr:hypothetical protein Mapa_000112 [Marchantia paleacea]